MSKELTRKRKSPEPSLGDAVNPELTCGNMRLHPNTVLGCTHLHTTVLGRYTHRNKETVSSWHQEPQGGGGRSKIPAKRIYSKGYIFAPPTSWISNILQCRRSNYNVFDGSTNTHSRPCGRWPLSKNKSRSVRKFSQNHCWGLWWSLIIRKCLGYWLAPLAGKTYLTFF